jgi:AraC family transcriptional regulator
MTALAATARLNRYAPGLAQAPHAHGAPHLSLLLAGGFAERVGRTDRDVGPGQLGLRPEGLRHDVVFGDEGALVLTLQAPDRDGDKAPFTEPSWTRALPSRHLRRLVPMILEGGDGAPEAVWDILALLEPPHTRAQADPWLDEVRRRIRYCPGPTRVSDLARRAGRHRVHLGRAFLAAYGETPSEYRRRAMLDRALAVVAAGESLAAAASEAGFVDQSHFSRACRDLYGLPPGRLTARIRA